MKHVRSFKKLVILVMAFVMICGSVNVSAATTTYKSGSKTLKYKGASYKVYYNSKQVSTSKKPALLINGNIQMNYKTLVSKGPKVKASYNKAKKKVVLSFNRKKVTLVANRKTMIVNGVKKKLYSAPVYVTTPTTTTNSAPAVTTNYDGITASVFANMTTAQFIATMGPIAQEDYHRSGVLASVTLAQAILESGWGKSNLASTANNMFGMKTSLSGNTWAGSTWDGCSFVTILTGEEYGGKHVTIQATFRKYNSVAQSVADHSAYLVNAKNGSAYRYAGLTNTKSYSEQLTIIKNGGYATSSSYVSQLSNLIVKYNLTQFDK